ncbi:MAG: CHAD domain-containing protein [Acidobacteriota bacterium]
MSYCLEIHETVPAGIKRVALEQLDQAAQQLSTADRHLDRSVHETRKSFKKIRAVLRLIDNEIGKSDYRFENAFYRDAARLLSPLRESAVNVQTLKKIARTDRRTASRSFAAIHAQLESLRLSRKADFHAAGAIEKTSLAVREARARVENWTLQSDDFSTLGRGIERLYRRGRKGLSRAYRDLTSEQFHEWRKEAKYLWYQMRLLEPLWPEAVGALTKPLDTLCDCLGEDHDLDELRSVLQKMEAGDIEIELRLLTQLIDCRHAELRNLIRPVGERIFSEEPRCFTRRLATYWQIWRRSGVEEPWPPT